MLRTAGPWVPQPPPWRARAHLYVVQARLAFDPPDEQGARRALLEALAGDVDKPAGLEEALIRSLLREGSLGAVNEAGQRMARLLRRSGVPTQRRRWSILADDIAEARRRATGSDEGNGWGRPHPDQQPRGDRSSVAEH